MSLILVGCPVERGHIRLISHVQKKRIIHKALLHHSFVTESRRNFVTGINNAPWNIVLRLDLALAKLAGAARAKSPHHMYRRKCLQVSSTGKLHALKACKTEDGAMSADWRNVSYGGLSPRLDSHLDLFQISLVGGTPDELLRPICLNGLQTGHDVKRSVRSIRLLNLLIGISWASQDRAFPPFWPEGSSQSEISPIIARCPFS